ncbi:MAG: hypothetical protein R8P61_15430 [Bacteroidia bacterium]|nr:hypothetical protein [Bacteroidia bacterium]
MWKYLKYFVPAICPIIWALYVFVLRNMFSYRLTDTVLIISGTCMLLFGAIWYLFYSKPQHRFTPAIIISLVFTLSPLFLRATSLVDIDYMAKWWLDRPLFVWQICLGLLILAFFYLLRFYFRPAQDPFSVLKLLIILLVVILAIVNFLFIDDDTTLTFSAVTVISLLSILPVVHIFDMLFWEGKMKREKENINSLDDLIEKISGS